jgi:hypothetical protein
MAMLNNQRVIYVVEGISVMIPNQSLTEMENESHPNIEHISHETLVERVDGNISD